MNSISPVQMLVKMGASGLLTKERLDQITGVQVTVEDEQPPRLDVRFNRSSHARFVEVDGRWQEQE